MVRIGHATNRTGFDKTPMRNKQCLATFLERLSYVEVELGQSFGKICDDAVGVFTDIGSESAESFVERNLHVLGHESEQFDLLMDSKSHGNAGFKCTRDIARVDLFECRHSLSNSPGKVNAVLRKMLPWFPSHRVSSMFDESGGHSELPQSVK